MEFGYLHPFAVKKGIEALHFSDGDDQHIAVPVLDWLIKDSAQVVSAQQILEHKQISKGKLLPQQRSPRGARHTEPCPALAAVRGKGKSFALGWVCGLSCDSSEASGSAVFSPTANGDLRKAFYSPGALQSDSVLRAELPGCARAGRCSLPIAQRRSCGTSGALLI